MPNELLSSWLSNNQRMIKNHNGKNCCPDGHSRYVTSVRYSLTEEIELLTNCKGCEVIKSFITAPLVNLKAYHSNPIEKLSWDDIDNYQVTEQPSGGIKVLSYEIATKRLVGLKPIDIEASDGNSYRVFTSRDTSGLERHEIDKLVQEELDRALKGGE